MTTTDLVAMQSISPEYYKKVIDYLNVKPKNYNWLHTRELIEICGHPLASTLDIQYIAIPISAGLADIPQETFRLSMDEVDSWINKRAHTLCTFFNVHLFVKFGVGLPQPIYRSYYLSLTDSEEDFTITQTNFVKETKESMAMTLKSYVYDVNTNPFKDRPLQTRLHYPHTIDDVVQKFLTHEKVQKLFTLKGWMEGALGLDNYLDKSVLSQQSVTQLIECRNRDQFLNGLFTGTIVDLSKPDEYFDS